MSGTIATRARYEAIVLHGFKPHEIHIVDLRKASKLDIPLFEAPKDSSSRPCSLKPLILSQRGASRK